MDLNVLIFLTTCAILLTLLYALWIARGNKRVILLMDTRTTRMDADITLLKMKILGQAAQLRQQIADNAEQAKTNDAQLAVNEAQKVINDGV